MRRWIWTAFASACGLLGAVAACSSFIEDPQVVADAAADAAAAPSDGETDGAAQDAPASSDSGDAQPTTHCVPVPTAAPCTSACASKLLLLPAPAPRGVVSDARITTTNGKLYVARVVDASRIELFTAAVTPTAWALLGSYPGSAVYDLGVSDTAILLSLRDLSPDGAPAPQRLVEIDLTCDAGCRGTTTMIPGSFGALHGVVAVGSQFYFSSQDALRTLAAGQTKILANTFGAPVVAGDCAHVYWSNAFDPTINRYDPITSTRDTVATGVAPDGGYDGSFPGTISLAVANDSLVASTGSGYVYSAPITPVHQAQLVANEPKVGKVLADDRFVYFERSTGFLTSSVVRVLPDGGAPQVMSPSVVATDMTSDADHLYVVAASGDVTRIAK